MIQWHLDYGFIGIIRWQILWDRLGETLTWRPMNSREAFKLSKTDKDTVGTDTVREQYSDRMALGWGTVHIQSYMNQEEADRQWGPRNVRVKRWSATHSTFQGWWPGKEEVEDGIAWARELEQGVMEEGEGARASGKVAWEVAETGEQTEMLGETRRGRSELRAVLSLALRFTRKSVRVWWDKKPP